MTLMRATRCTARSSRSGERCRRLAPLGGTVCRAHGGAAPQVKAAAARRVTLAEALANGDRRHPAEVLDDALRLVDIVGQQLVAGVVDGQVAVSPEIVNAVLDSARQTAGIARLVLDTGGGDPRRWSAREAYRQQAEALASVCREFASLLGYDPADPQVQEAFDAAVEVVVHGARRPLRPAVVNADARPVRALPAAPPGDTVDGAA